VKAKIISLDASLSGNLASGEQELNPAIFGLPSRADILHRMVEWQRAKRRAGTHKTKGVSEVSGTTKKPFKQKGGGRARQGSLRSTQFRGGGVIFGPVVRSHAHDLTKKFRKLALKTALSVKQSTGSLLVLTEATVNDGKAATLASQLKVLGWVKPLIIDAEPNELFVRAARNLKNVDVLPIVGINVYDILKHKELVLTKAALESLEARLA